MFICPNVIESGRKLKAIQIGFGQFSNGNEMFLFFSFMVTTDGSNGRSPIECIHLETDGNDFSAFQIHDELEAWRVVLDVCPSCPFL